MTIPQSFKELISRWHKRTREIQESQYETAKRFRLENKSLGIIVLILNVIVGSSIFLSIKTDLGDTGKLISGFMILLAALLAGLQTYLKLNEQAEKHQSAGVNAGILRRTIEQVLAKGDLYVISDDDVNKIREEFDKLSKDAPNVPNTIWKATEKKLELDQ